MCLSLRKIRYETLQTFFCSNWHFCKHTFLTFLKWLKFMLDKFSFIHRYFHFWLSESHKVWVSMKITRLDSLALLDHFFFILILSQKPEFGSDIKSDPRSKSESEARMARGERFSSLLDVGQIRVGALEIEDTGLPLRRLTVRKTSVEKIRTRTTHAVFY